MTNINPSTLPNKPYLGFGWNVSEYMNNIIGFVIAAELKAEGIEHPKPVNFHTEEISDILFKTITSGDTGRVLMKLAYPKNRYIILAWFSKEQ